MPLRVPNPLRMTNSSRSPPAKTPTYRYRPPPWVFSSSVTGASVRHLRSFGNRLRRFRASMVIFRDHVDWSHGPRTRRSLSSMACISVSVRG